MEDHARALRLVLTKGRVGETYTIGGNCEKTNIEVVRAICNILEELLPFSSLIAHRSSPGTQDSLLGTHCSSLTTHYAELITFVPDRPGHDRRYAIDASKIQRELGWQPQETFESGLRKTVEWYIDNPEWVRRVRTGEYREWVENNYAMQGRGCC